MDALPSEDRERFAAELVQAAYDFFSGDTAEPVVSTVRAWYKSALFMGLPGFQEKLSGSLDDLKRLQTDTS